MLSRNIGFTCKIVSYVKTCEQHVNTGNDMCTTRDIKLYVKLENVKTHTRRTSAREIETY